MPRIRGRPHSMLLVLPVELLVTVLSHLSGKDVARCLSVNKALHDLIRNSVQLQYTMELDASGYTEGLDKASTWTQRLELLRNFQRRWKDLPLDWRQRLRTEPAAIFHLFHRYLVHNDISADKSRLTLFELPSMINGQHSLTSKQYDIEFDVAEVTLDEGQDLMVLTRTEMPLDLCIRTMSTNEVHPNAFQPSISFDFTDRVHHAIQILNHRIAIVPDIDADSPDELALPPRFKMGVFNWKTGTLRVHTVPPNKGCWFISATRFIVAVQCEGNAPCIELHEMLDDDTESAVTHLFTFKLPRLRATASLEKLSLYGGWNSQPDIVRRSPFQLDPAAAILVLELAISKPKSSELDRFNIILRRNTFMRRAEPNPSCISSPIVYEWEDWGKNHTRFFASESCGGRWASSVFGNRHARLVPDEGQLRAQVRIMDFHPETVRRYQRTTNNASHRVVIDDTCVVCDVFEGEVKTSLPYVELSPSMRCTANGIMIGSENIVAALVSSEEVQLEIFMV